VRADHWADQAGQRHERGDVEARLIRDLGIGKLVGQVLAAAVKKDMIQEILRDEVPPSSSLSDSTIHEISNSL
jgi:hypothetical protein